MMDDSLKNVVDDKIIKYTLFASGFSKKELDSVDNYCKTHFGGDRKAMILSLISIIENNYGYSLLNEKFDLLTNSVFDELDKIKEKLYKDKEYKEDKVDEKPKWKGFSKTE